MTDAYNPATRPCAHGPQPGTLSLQGAILDYWPQTTDLGIFNCRPTAGGSPSVHGNGRAGDIGFHGAQLGDDIASWLVANHTLLGVQLVIVLHHIWNVSKPGWRPYGCDAPHSPLDHHTTHVHWEQNVEGSYRVTRAVCDTVRPHAPTPHPPPVVVPEEIPMDFFILNDANDQTADLWYWWPELGDGDKGRRAIIPRGSAITKAQASRRYCGELELDRPDLDAIPTLR